MKSNAMKTNTQWAMVRMPCFRRRHHHHNPFYSNPHRTDTESNLYESEKASGNSCKQGKTTDV